MFVYVFTTVTSFFFSFSTVLQTCNRVRTHFIFYLCLSLSLGSPRGAAVLFLFLGPELFQPLFVSLGYSPLGHLSFAVSHLRPVHYPRQRPILIHYVRHATHDTYTDNEGVVARQVRVCFSFQARGSYPYIDDSFRSQAVPWLYCAGGDRSHWYTRLRSPGKKKDCGRMWTGRFFVF